MDRLLSHTDFIVAMPELFLAVALMLLLMVGVFRTSVSAIKPMQVDRMILLSVFVLVLTAGMLIDGTSSFGAAFNTMFLSSPFTLVMKMLVVISAIFVLLMTLPYARGKAQYPIPIEMPILILLAVLGLMLMISANDLMALYLGLELASLSLYVLAAMERDNTKSNEAGLKYFVLGAVASGLLLYGCSLIYGFTGATGFYELGQLSALLQPSGATGVVVGLVFVIIGLCFKVSAVPFHMWAPDVYEGAPTYVTAFFSTAPKVAALALFIRVLMEPFAALADQWQQVILFVSVASMLVGAFAAIRQHNIKRLLAYSSIGHVGYALMGLAIHTTAGIQGVIVYLTLYIVMSAGMFACVMLMRRKGSAVEEIYDLRGLSRTHPKMAFAIGIFMFSMAGIPPLAGFFGKMMVFLAVVDAGFIWLAVVGVLASVVAAYYYLRVIKIMYLDEVDAPLDEDITRESRLLIGATAAFTMLFMLYPTPLLEIASVAAFSLGLL